MSDAELSESEHLSSTQMTMEYQQRGYQYVVDGGMLLQIINWQLGASFEVLLVSLEVYCIGHLTVDQH